MSNLASIPTYKLDIDYDQLAKAIIKAQQESDNPNKYDARTHLMKFLNGTSHMFVLSILVIVAKNVWDMLPNVDDTSKVFYILFIVMLVVLAVLLFMCQQESLSDNYGTAKNQLDLNLSLIALIVALMAYIKS